MAQFATNKHLGKLKTSDRRVIVIYWALPGEQFTGKTCVLDIDSLPDQLKDLILTMVRSPDAQHVLHFGDLMDRRQFPNTQQSVLKRYAAYTQIVPHTHVTMTPEPNRSFDMDHVIAEFQKAGVNVLPGAKPTATTELEEVGEPSFLDAPIPRTTQEMGDPANYEFQARNKIIQAEMLEADARKLRLDADQLLAKAGNGRRFQAIPQEMTMQKAVGKIDKRTQKATTVSAMVAGATAKGRPGRKPKTATA